jgi:hypothetical protein
VPARDDAKKTTFVLFNIDHFSKSTCPTVEPGQIPIADTIRVPTTPPSEVARHGFLRKPDKPAFFCS